MGIGKVSSLAVASLAKVNSLAKLSINKINSVAASFAAAFADSNAVSRAVTAGVDHKVEFTDTADTFNFCEDEAWSISIWVKAGWTASLNTNIHFIIGQATSPSSQSEDMIKIIYNESNNRLYYQVKNKVSGTTKTRQGFWLFHANYDPYDTAYAAAGLGTSYWSASNRGNVGDNDFTMITLTKAAAEANTSYKMYWNATPLNNAVSWTGSTGFPSGYEFSETDDRVWNIGCNGLGGGTTYDKTGDTAETVYNDLTMWDAELSASDVTELYNSGARMDATSHSAESNLVGYWKFESDGTATVSSHDFTISGDSNIAGVEE